MSRLGLVLFIFIPIIESFSRFAGLSFLFFGSILIAFPLFSKNKLKLDFVNFIFLTLLIWLSFSTIFSLSILKSFTEVIRYFAYFLIFSAIRQFTYSPKT